MINFKFVSLDLSRIDSPGVNWTFLVDIPRSEDANAIIGQVLSQFNSWFVTFHQVNGLSYEIAPQPGSDDTLYSLFLKAFQNEENICVIDDRKRNPILFFMGHRSKTVGSEKLKFGEIVKLFYEFYGFVPTPVGRSVRTMAQALAEESAPNRQPVVLPNPVARPRPSTSKPVPPKAAPRPASTFKHDSSSSSAAVASASDTALSDDLDAPPIAPPRRPSKSSKPAGLSSLGDQSGPPPVVDRNLKPQDAPPLPERPSRFGKQGTNEVLGSQSQSTADSEASSAAPPSVPRNLKPSLSSVVTTRRVPPAPPVDPNPVLPELENSVTAMFFEAEAESATRGRVGRHDPQYSQVAKMLERLKVSFDDGVMAPFTRNTQVFEALLKLRSALRSARIRLDTESMGDRRGLGALHATESNASLAATNQMQLWEEIAHLFPSPAAPTAERTKSFAAKVLKVVAKSEVGELKASLRGIIDQCLPAIDAYVNESLRIRGVDVSRKELHRFVAAMADPKGSSLYKLLFDPKDRIGFVVGLIRGCLGDDGAALFLHNVNPDEVLPIATLRWIIQKPQLVKFAVVTQSALQKSLMAQGNGVQPGQFALFSKVVLKAKDMGHNFDFVCSTLDSNGIPFPRPLVNNLFTLDRELLEILETPLVDYLLQGDDPNEKIDHIYREFDQQFAQHLDGLIPRLGDLLFTTIGGAHTTSIGATISQFCEPMYGEWELAPYRRMVEIQSESSRTSGRLKELITEVATAFNGLYSAMNPRR